MDFNAMTDKELRKYLKSNGVKFSFALKREALLQKATEFEATKAKGAVEASTPPSAVESPATGNVETIAATPDSTTTTPDTVTVPIATTTTVPAVEPKYEPPKPNGDGEKLATYNPETHIVVNKRRFEAMIWALSLNKPNTYIRQNIHQRLAELLDLPGGQEEARKLQKEIAGRVLATL